MTNEKGTEMLKQIAEYYGISKNSDFAKFFGLSIQTSFQRFKNGFIDFEQIYAKCPDISPDWLLSGGEGPMLRSERGEMIASQNSNIGGGTQSVSVVQSDKNTESLLKALAKEQETLARSQEQVSNLIELLKAAGKN